MGAEPFTLPQITLLEGSYQLKLRAFEGPLDLLLHLIKREQVDIYDIPIALITERYLEYLQRMQEENVNLAGEFIEMAATLIFIKSRTLLPPAPSANGEMPAEEDPMKELVDKLIELDKFKNVAQILYTREQLEAGVWSIPHLPDVIAPDEELVSVSLYELLQAFQSVLKRCEDRIAFEMDREEVTVAEKISQIESLIKHRRKIWFSEFLRQPVSRLHLVVLIMALLELARMKTIALRQEELFDDILIVRRRPAS